MKKSIRVLTSLLVLLALLVSLPISAMALENNDEDDATIDTEIGRNTGSNVTVAASGTVNQNDGDVGNNYGTVVSNSAKGYIGNNAGDVVSNANVIAVNSGTVNQNTSTGRIDGNIEGGTVDINEGFVGNTGGTVRENKSGTVTNYEGGIVGKNQGTVYNLEGGVVHENSATGQVKTNAGTTTYNYGTVEKNTSTGSVGIFEMDEDGYVTNSEGGNFGTIGTNEGFVYQNGGNVYNDETHENEELQGTITTNKGTVQENNILGEIGTNAAGAKVFGNNGTIGENFGEVTNNNGVVTNKSGGEVVFNMGTVINEAGGKVNEYVIETDDPLSDDEPTPSKTITAEGTYYGVDIMKGYDEEAMNAGTWTFGYGLVQKKQGEALNLSNIFKQDGYEVIGYVTEDENYEEVTVEGTTYNEDKPGFLTLIWSKIKEIITPAPAAPADSSSEPEVKPVSSVSYPSTVAAEDVKVGTIVQRKGKMFKVIEMDDGSILVATIGKLSKKDLEDMKAFLAQYFTEEQIAKLLSEPELLSDELIAKYFGGDIEHISFRATKDLFAK